MRESKEPVLARLKRIRWSDRRADIATVVSSFRAALEAVSHNTLRAGLTSLGILFGVASVIAMLAIGRGAEQEILEQMRLLGANTIIITPLETQEDEEVQEEPGRVETRRFSPGLTWADARSLAAVLSDVHVASGEIALESHVTRGGRRRSAKLVGVDSSYFSALGLERATGAGFAAEHYAKGAAVAVIGDGLRARFFPTENPLGQQLKVGGGWLTVVGVLQPRPVSEQTAQRLGIRDANMDVYVPLTTMLTRYRDRSRVTQNNMRLAAMQRNTEVTFIGGNSGEPDDEAARAERRNYHQLDRIVLRVADAEAMNPVAEVSRRLLERRHNQNVDFEIVVPEQLLRQEQRTKRIFNLVLGAIASISLIVGGIGIMNIMLATVLERIREIGVRRAVGATRRDVVAQFLSEAVIISVAGGIAGIALGVLCSVAIERFAGIQTIVAPTSIILAFGVSLTVGLVFGIVPAWRAAQQDPVVCLRYE